MEDKDHIVPKQWTERENVVHGERNQHSDLVSVGTKTTVRSKETAGIDSKRSLYGITRYRFV